MSGGGNDEHLKPATRLVRGGRRKEWTGPVVNPPIWRGSTHLYDCDADRHAAGGNNADGQFFYGHIFHPTVRHKLMGGGGHESGFGPSGRLRSGPAFNVRRG